LPILYRALKASSKPTFISYCHAIEQLRLQKAGHVFLALQLPPYALGSNLNLHEGWQHNASESGLRSIWVQQLCSCWHSVEAEG